MGEAAALSLLCRGWRDATTKPRFDLGTAPPPAAEDDKGSCCCCCSELSLARSGSSEALPFPPAKAVAELLLLRKAATLTFLVDVSSPPTMISSVFPSSSSSSSIALSASVRQSDPFPPPPPLVLADIPRMGFPGLLVGVDPLLLPFPKTGDDVRDAVADAPGEAAPALVGMWSGSRSLLRVPELVTWRAEMTRNESAGLGGRGGSCDTAGDFLEEGRPSLKKDEEGRATCAGRVGARGVRAVEVAATTPRLEELLTGEWSFVKEELALVVIACSGSEAVDPPVFCRNMPGAAGGRSGSCSGEAGRGR